jgi:hypothetical protein
MIDYFVRRAFSRTSPVVFVFASVSARGGGGGATTGNQSGPLTPITPAVVRWSSQSPSLDDDRAKLASAASAHARQEATTMNGGRLAAVL